MSQDTNTLDAVGTEKKSPRAAAPARRRHEPDRFDDDEGEPKTFFQRHRVLAVLAILGALGAVLAVAKSLTAKSAAPRRAPELPVVSIKLPPLPPPPPPPPPPPTEQPRQEMIEQTPVEKDEKPPEAPQPPAISTSLKGPGPGMAGLAPIGSGPGTFGGSGGGRSKWGYYAAGVQTRIKDAMQNNRKVRTAKFSGVVARIWADSTGRISRAELKASTGDRSVDDAIRNEVLAGLQLNEPPPADMPMPITLRINAQGAARRN